MDDLVNNRLSSLNEVLHDMQKTLECAICLDLMNDPLTTKCGHSFCRLCLDKAMTGTKSGGTACPLCQTMNTKRSLTKNKKIVGLSIAVRKIIDGIKEDCGFGDNQTKKANSPEKKIIDPLPQGEGVDLHQDGVRRGMRKREQVIYFAAEDASSKKKQIQTNSSGSNTNKKRPRTLTKPFKLLEIGENSSKKITNLNSIQSDSSSHKISANKSNTNSKSEQTSKTPGIIKSEASTKKKKKDENLPSKSSLSSSSNIDKVSQWLESSHDVNFGIRAKEKINEDSLLPSTANVKSQSSNQKKDQNKSELLSCPPLPGEKMVVENSDDSSLENTIPFSPKEVPAESSKGKSISGKRDAKPPHSSLDACEKQDHKELKLKNNNSLAAEEFIPPIDTVSLVSTVLFEPLNCSLVPDKDPLSRSLKLNEELKLKKPLSSLRAKEKENILEVDDKNAVVFAPKPRTYLRKKPLLQSDLNIPFQKDIIDTGEKISNQANKNLTINDNKGPMLPPRDTAPNRGKSLTSRQSMSKLNISIASEMKSKILNKSKTTTPVTQNKTKSPGWSHVKRIGRDLRSRRTSLRIKGGEEKIGDSKPDSLLSTTATQETDIVIDDTSQTVSKLPVREKSAAKNVKGNTSLSLNKKSPKQISGKTNVKDYSHNFRGGDNSSAPVEVPPTPPNIQKTEISKDTNTPVLASVDSTHKVAEHACSKVIASEIKIPQQNCKDDLNYPKSGHQQDSNLFENKESKQQDIQIGTCTNSMLLPNQFATQDTHCRHVIPCELFQALKRFFMTTEDCKRRPATEKVLPHSSAEYDVDCQKADQSKLPEFDLTNLTQNRATFDVESHFPSKVSPVKENTNNVLKDLTKGKDNNPLENIQTGEKCGVQNFSLEVAEQKKTPCLPNSETGIIAKGISESILNRNECNFSPTAKERQINRCDIFESEDLQVEETELMDYCDVKSPSQPSQCSSIKILSPNSNKDPSQSIVKSCRSTFALFTQTEKEKEVDFEASDDSIEIPVSRISIRRKSAKRKLSTQNISKKKYKRIFPSSPDSNSSDDSEHKPNPKDQEAPTVEEDSEPLVDSEELRDFRRYDKNIYEYFNKASLEEGDNKSTSQKDFPASSSHAPENIDLISSDDEIPGTLEVLKNVKEDLLAVREPKGSLLDCKSKDFSEFGSQKSVGSVSLSNSESISNEKRLNTEKHFSIYEESEICIKETNTENADSNNLSHSSAFSSQSGVITTQKRNKMQNEVLDIQAKIDALEKELEGEKEKNNDAEANPVLSGDEDEPLNSLVASSQKESKIASLNEEFSDEEFHKSLDSNTSKPVENTPKVQNEVHKSYILMCTGLNDAEVQKVSEFSCALCDVNTKLINVWHPSVTHVIVKTNPDGLTERTLKYLFAVANGKWVISFNWVLDSLEASTILSEEDYEALDCSGVAASRKARNLDEPIFKGYQFCLSPPFLDVSEDNLKKLLEDCGATIVKDPSSFKRCLKSPRLALASLDDADYDIVEDWLKKFKQVTVAHEWVIECIGMCENIPLVTYFVGDPKKEHFSACHIPNALLEEL